MKYSSLFKKLSAFLASCLVLASCNEVREGKQAVPKSEKDSHTKWLKLTEALKLTDNPAEPTKFYEDAAEYQKLLVEAAGRYNRDAFKTRCASIEGIHPVNIKRNRNIDIYHFEYKLQKNFEGEAESQTRSAYLTIPRSQADAEQKFPILAYAHGGDKGVSYTKELSKLDKLLDDYIVLAPAFPGETLASDEEPENLDDEIWLGTAPVGESIPWNNDVDDLLGAHDCIAREVYLHLEKESDADLYEKLKNEINEENKENTLKVLQTLKEKTKTYGADLVTGGIKNYPKSIVMGASRGGLVASIAVARSGSIAASLLGLNSQESKADDEGENKDEENSSLQAKLINYVKELNGGLKPESYELFKGLGNKYGTVPPLFSGLATLSAPATVTIGRFRLILEQMVKGNTEFTVAKHLPGIRSLGHIFDRYLETGDVEEAKFEIVLRDLSFVAPLIIGALKDWGSPLNGGSMLLIHGSKDKVVPVEQTQATANIFQNLLENDMIKQLSPTGVKVMTQYFDSQESLEEGIRFHLDDAFANSHSYHYSHLLQDRTLKAVMSSEETPIPPHIKLIEDKLEEKLGGFDIDFVDAFIPGLKQSVAKFEEVKSLHTLASDSKKIREQKISALQASMQQIVETSQKEVRALAGEEHIEFRKQDIPSEDRILQVLVLADALGPKEFVEKHLKTEKLLHLAVLYQLSHGGFNNAGKGLNTGSAPKAVQLETQEGEKFLSLKEDHGPYNVVEAWGRQLK